MRKKAFLISIFLSLEIWAAPVQIVKDGSPVAEIVTAQDANQSIKLAAKDLQYYLQKISGAELKIVNVPTSEFKNQIYVGESEFTKKLGFTPAKFNNSGFEIIAKNNYVILSGTDRLSKASPYSMSVSDSRYAAGKISKPADYPSSGLKKWQDFCGEKFTTKHVNNGGSSFNTKLNININDDTGTWYAVSELLEQLGVRFYAPYENGTVIPEIKNIAIAEQNFKSEAAFARREWCYYGAMREDKEGIEWLKRLKCGNYTTIIYNHTTYAIYSSKEQQELHPEYLACDKDGKPYSGYPAGHGMPRYTNPDFRRASVVFMNKIFDAFPELTAISMGPPDGGIKMDARDIKLYGKDGDSIEQRTSNYVWDYNVFLAKELKKSHPGKFLLYMNGAGATLLPANLKSDDPDNIIIPFAQPYSAYRVINATNKEVIEKRKKWLAALHQRGKSPIWDYYLYYRTPTFPRFPIFFTESLQNEMREMRPYADGKFIELNLAVQSNGAKGSAGWRIGEPAIMHLMMYWQNKLFWNPNADRKAIFEEYYKLYFGPAAAEMKEFHEFAEEVWCRQESRSVTQTTGFLKEKDIDKYFEILAKARAKAGKDTVYDRRIAAMETAYQPLKKLFANLQRKGPDIRAYTIPDNITLDGNLTKYKYGWHTLRDRATGDTPQLNKTDVCVSLSENKKYLYVAAICYENKMDKIRADTKLNDTASIFNDDVLEIYINTPERSYFKIVVNPNGVIWDETTDVSIVERDTLPILWNPGTKAVVKKYDDRWTVELMVPTKDFGSLGPTKQYPWGIQIGRTRFAEACEAWALAPGTGPYATLNQWGNLWVR